MKTVSAFAPATVANVSCGFDVLGFAVNDLGDTVTVNFSDLIGLNISQIDGDDGKLPLDADKNVCTVAIQAMLTALGQNVNISLSLKKGLPLGSGLGSSAASTVAALVATNELLGNPLSKKELLPFAMEGERIACGSAHADNVAPSLFGGFTLIRDYETLDIISLPTPEDIHITLVHPHYELNTADSRRVLRKQITLSESRTQSGNIAGLVASLYTNDFELMKRSLKDVIAEPSRALLIPGFFETREAILKVGAIGSGISGSGPTIFIISADKETALKTKSECQNLYQNLGLNIDIHISTINKLGAQVLAP